MVFKAHKGLRGFLFPSPPHLISLSGTCCKLMRLRIQQNNCVKEQICSFCFIKTKRQRGRAGSRFRDGKANENLVPANPPGSHFCCNANQLLVPPQQRHPGCTSALLHLEWQQEYSYLCTAGEDTSNLKSSDPPRVWNSQQHPQTC